ncbi:MAG: MBL fold metallo-hydrolase [Nitrospinota bacterium]|jgi:L-ascorbate metabolism protein UlaG (beta-lactamase superfamily)|nr:MBL fold metallo-hydrolase [Nitrospinota bacterium]
MRVFQTTGFVSSRLARALIAAALLLIPMDALGACVLNVAERVPWIQRVSSHGPISVPPGHLRVTYLGHFSFLVETPGGASIVTDYNDQAPPSWTPDAATMSNAHNLHSSDTIDPAVTRSLRGWDPKGGVARVDVKIKDARVFNVATNFSEFGGVRTNGNSIFVVEAAGLCVAHLGNLRHLLDKKTLRVLGRIDVLFISADGSWTLNHADALRLIRQIGPAIVIPMQYDFMGPSVFGALAECSFPVKVHDKDHLLVSRKTLSRRTEVVFLRGR